VCGIIAWSGKDSKQFNSDKLNILGLFNESRGGDSCGVAVDGEIYYGVDKNKKFEDFIINKNYPKPKGIPAVIGHTRKGSVGLHTIHNAHPFGYGDLDGNYEFIGCHNGTLIDYEELAKKYEIEVSIYNANNVWDRRKNDSEVLLEILYKTRNINVLEEYVGGAALVFQDLREPDTIFAFHGASKKEVGDNGLIYEERPLYYYQESKNSLYISSIEEALLFIGGEKDKNVFEFEHNILYEIKNGNVKSAVEHQIDRSNVGQKKAYGGNFSKGGANVSTTNKNINVNHLTKSQRRRIKNKSSVTNIFNERGIRNEFPCKIYYENLRYKRNGHHINGIYTWIKGFGFYKLTEELKEIDKISYNLISRYFSLFKERFIGDDELDEILKIDNTLFIPFIVGQHPSLNYMYNGVLLETAEDYLALKSGFKNFTIEDLSTMSRYPICNLKKNSEDNQNIIYNAQKYSNNFTPIGSNNIYNIEQGNLISIDKLEEYKEDSEKTSDGVQIELPIKLDCCSLILPEKLPVDLTKRPVIPFLSEKDLEEENEFYNNEKEKTKVISIVDQHFLPIYSQMQIVHENLKNEDNEEIQLLIESGKEYLMSIDCVSEQYEK